MKRIFILLRAQTGRDFTAYKPNMILRRVDRRMALHQIDRLDAYVGYLRKNPEELNALYRDLLIGVTKFFRDPEAFAALEDKIVPGLFNDDRRDASVRVWVPGCSTGEEAYSIAILLQERQEALKRGFRLKVFATDIDRKAIEQARAGVFPASIAADLSPERLARYFALEPEGGAFRIHKVIRDMVIFSEQDVISDPPFSKLDLISCRNLMIYLDADLQKKLIPRFHYALNPGGVLFLGTSETVGEFGDLFSAIDRKLKLYRRKDGASAGTRPRPEHEGPRSKSGDVGPRPSAKEIGGPKIPLRWLAERAMLEQVAPVGALVNRQGDILYLHGRTGRYLEPAPGEPDQNIQKMAREGLRRPLAAALRQAAKSDQIVRLPGLKVRTNGEFAVVDLTIRPLTPEAGEALPAGLFLALFEEAPRAVPSRPGKASGGRTAAGALRSDRKPSDRLAALERELASREEDIRTAIEETEKSNEELKSYGEEMQSVNEELQSTNEELETSKEELQSVNEELATVNTELQAKVTDLSQANNDLNNLLAATGIGTVFLDLQLRIQRFTPAAVQVLHLLPTDVGRPVEHIASSLAGYGRLKQDVQAVLDSLVPREIEVQTAAGAWFQMRIQPYRTVDNTIEGAVVTFVDITDVKKSRQALQEAALLRRLAAVARDANDAILVQDLQGRILAWNPGAERIYGWTETEALAMNARDRIPPGRLAQEAAALHRLGRADILEPYRTQRIAKDGRVVEVWLTATALVSEAGQMYAVATTERPLSGRPVD